MNIFSFWRLRFRLNLELHYNCSRMWIRVEIEITIESGDYFFGCGETVLLYYTFS